MYTRTSSAGSPPSHNPTITHSHSRSPSRTTPGRRPSPEPRPLYSPLPSTPPPRVHHHSPSRTPVKTPPSNPTPPRNSPLRTNTPPRPPTFTRVSPSRNAPPSRISSGNINAQSSPSPSPSRRPPSTSVSSTQDIIVMVRSRPYLPSERRFGKDVLRMETRNSAAITTLTDPQSRAEYPFVTNFAFQSHDRNHPLHADQAYVVSALVRPLTNCPSNPPMRASLICYGPPGTGKSMSMFGKPSSAHLAGALPAFCRAIIANSLTSSRPQIQMQALELRSDRVYDLLLDRRRWSPSGVSLKTNPSNGECNADAIWVPCPHYDSILQCIDMIERNRSTHSHPTHPRAHSGHAFVTVKVSQPSGSVYQVHFIDLAGSGRSEGNDTSISTERAWLNQSLGSLRRMISNITATPSTKLAHLLQVPLSTSQPLVLLVTLAPSVEGFEDALHSLRFAEHVKRMVDSRQRASPSSDISSDPIPSKPSITTTTTTTTTISTTNINTNMDIRPPSTDLPGPPSRDSPIAKISTTSMSPKNMHPASPPTIIPLNNNGPRDLEGRNSPLFVDNVVIAVRIRPFPEKEKEESAVKPVEGGVAVTNPSSGDRHIFPAHIVFDESNSQFSHQERIYGTFASMVRDAVNNGHRIAFITYGQTGAGKTHTMLGKVGSPHLEGLFPRCCQGLFSSNNSNSTLLTVDLQAVEVFADQVNDLLIPRTDWPAQGCGLNTSVNNQFEASCSNFHCVHYSELRKAVEAIYQNRSLHSHQFNTEANASHLLCTLTVSVLPDGRASNGVRLSRLHFIDLGGLSGEDNQDLTDEQITGINRALVYLFQAVKALTTRRVPSFSETNLNKLMRTPLMQSERIVLLNAVNPSSSSYVETCNTLHFAQLFKNIRPPST